MCRAQREPDSARADCQTQYQNRELLASVHVSMDEHGNARLDALIKGDTVREVLQYVQFSADELMRTMRKRVEKALREQKMTVDESRVLLRFYESGLEGYTYLE